MATSLDTKAIILRRTNYGEADRILTVLTPDDGQLAVIARGVRREKSRLAGGIELFSECQLSLVRSSMNIDGMWTLTGSRIIKFYDEIMADYDRLQFGYEAIKQIAGISNVVDSPELYDKLCQSFGTLNNLNLDLRLVKTWFYINLAKLKGSELNLMTDANGMKLVEDARYDFDLGAQVFFFNEAGHYDARVIKLLRVMSVNEAAILGRLNGVDNLVITDALYLAQVAAKV